MEDIANDPREREAEDLMLGLTMARADQEELAALRAEKEQLTEALANLNDRYIHVSDLHIDKNARIAQLKAALRPFLKYGGHSLRQDTGDADYLVESFQLGTDEPKCELYMSDFRRAAAALKEEP